MANDSLRIQLERRDSGVVQKVLPGIKPCIQFLQFSTNQSFDQYANQYASEPMDIFEFLSEFTVVQVEGRTGILVKLHHMIADAWSLQLMERQLTQILGGEKPESYAYTKYLISEQQYLESGRYDRSKAFW